MFGSMDEMELLSEALEKRFRARKVCIDDEVSFNGFFIRHYIAANTTLDISRHPGQIQPATIEKDRRVQRS